MYRKIIQCLILTIVTPAISIAQEMEEPMDDEIALHVTKETPTFIWYFASGFALFVTAACTLLCVLLLRNKIEFPDRQRFGLLIFCLAIPIIVMFAFFVQGFDGWIVYAILAAVIGFAAGNPFTLLNRNQNDDE